MKRKKVTKKRAVTRASAIRAAKQLQRLLKNPHVRRIQEMCDSLSSERASLRAQLHVFLNPTWRTREGEMIPMAALQDDHLRNCIVYCSRRVLYLLASGRWVGESYTYARDLARLIEEARRRGIKM